MPIPQKKATVQQDITSKTCMFYGHPKCGKSTFWSKAPDTIFLATEPGLNSVECFRWEHANGDYVIRSWDDFKRAVAEVKAAKRFRTVVIDTIDNAWLLCQDHVCRQNKVEYVNDGALGYGKGGALIQNEMRRTLVDLCDSHFGLVLVSHARLEEVEGLAGTAKKWMPTLHDKCRAVVLGMVDLILFVDVIAGADGKTTRVIRSEPSRLYEAGDRTGRLPETVALNYDTFVEAYNAGKSQAHTVKPATPPVAAAPAPAETPSPATPATAVAGGTGSTKPAPTPATSASPSTSGPGVEALRALAAKASVKHGNDLVRSEIKKITGGGIAQAKPEHLAALETLLKGLVNAA